MMRPGPLDHWPAFSEVVRARLEAGDQEYEGRSFERAPTELVGEIEEELADVCGWAFVLWCQLRGLQQKLAVIGADNETD